MNVPTPLTHLFSAVADTCDHLVLLGKRAFERSDQRDEPVNAVEYVGPFRTAAADLIVWLESKGRSADAEEIDDAVASLLEVVWAYDRGGLQAWHPEDEQAGPVEPLDQLVDAMRAAAGRLEDLDDQIPAEVWEGYDDA